MKKIMTVFIIMGCMLSFILPVKAKELTFNEIVDKFESTPLQGEHSMFEEMKNKATIKKTDNSFTITYNMDGTEIKTVFKYENGWITYQYDGDKNGEDTFAKSLIESIWIEHLIATIGILQGYSYEEIANYFKNEENIEAIETIEISHFTYNYQSEDGSANISGSGIDTFKIDINNFKIEETESSGNQSETTDNELKQSGDWSVECTELNSNNIKTCRFFYTPKSNIEYIAVEVNVDNFRISNEKNKNNFELITSSNITVRNPLSAQDTVYYFKANETLKPNEKIEVFEIDLEKQVLTKDTTLKFSEYNLSCTFSGGYFWDKYGNLTDLDHWDGCNEGGTGNGNTGDLNDIENPQTYDVTNILIVGAFVSMGLALILIKRKNNIKKI